MEDDTGVQQPERFPGSLGSYTPLDRPQSKTGYSAKASCCLTCCASTVVFFFLLELIIIIVLGIEFDKYKNDHPVSCPQCAPVCVDCDLGWRPRDPAPRFVLDLNSEPSERWKEPLDFIYSKYGWNNSFGPLYDQLREMNSVISPGYLAQLNNYVLSNPDLEEYRGELQGVSDFFTEKGHNVTFWELLGYTYFYEIHHTPIVGGSKGSFGCTSVIVRSKEGNVIHARNLDFPRAFTNVTVQMEWRKDGRTLFRSTNFVGWGGLFVTGERGDAFSFSINWRPGVVEWPDLLAFAAAKSVPIGILARELAVSSTTFHEFAMSVATANLGSPAYFVVAGPGSGDGWVLTRANGTQLDRNDTFGDGEYYDQLYGGETWFVVQTNSDAWVSDPFQDPRRQIAIRALRWLGQDNAATYDGVFRVLSAVGQESRGVLNDMTCFTSIMSPKSDYLESYLRHFVWYAPRGDWTPYPPYNGTVISSPSPVQFFE